MNKSPELVCAWQMDMFCPMSDGDGIRIEYDAEEGQGSNPTFAFHALKVVTGGELDADSVKKEYLCQTPDGLGLASWLENVAYQIRKTLKEDQS